MTRTLILLPVLLMAGCATPQSCGDRNVLTTTGGSSSESATAVNVGGVIDLIARIVNGGCG